VNLIKDKSYKCLICGEEHGFDDIHTLEINGEEKKICKGCVTAIKGIV